MSEQLNLNEEADYEAAVKATAEKRAQIVASLAKLEGDLKKLSDLAVVCPIPLELYHELRGQLGEIDLLAAKLNTC